MLAVELLLEWERLDEGAGRSRWRKGWRASASLVAVAVAALAEGGAAEVEAEEEVAVGSAAPFAP